MRRPAAWLIPALGLALLFPAPGGAAETIEVTAYDWSAGALGTVIEGRAVVAVLADGTWRASVSDLRVDPAVLTSEAGEGWTLIGLGPDEVWWSEWRGPSQAFDPDTSGFLERIVHSLAASGDTPPWRHAMTRPVDLDADAEAPPEPAAAPTSLGSRLAHRASGRGGAQETWWCRAAATPAGPALRLRSRRRPGSLEIRPTGTRGIQADPYEFLVPAWSIDELTDND